MSLQSASRRAPSALSRWQRTAAAWRPVELRAWPRWLSTSSRRRRWSLRHDAQQNSSACRYRSDSREHRRVKHIAATLPYIRHNVSSSPVQQGSVISTGDAVPGVEKLPERTGTAFPLSMCFITLHGRHWNHFAAIVH